MKTAAIATTVVILMILTTTSAHAAEFVFDPLSGDTPKKIDFLVPAALMAVALTLGALIIALERRKAKGIWFSNSETLK